MKKRTLCSLALVAAIGATTLATPAFADNGLATQKESAGKVEFKEDTDGSNEDKDPEPDGNVTPGEGEEIDPPYTPNEDKGPLMIDGVTDLEFKVQKAVTTDKLYYAEQVPVYVNGTKGTANEEIKGYRGNYLQFTDRRVDNRTPYTLQASMTKQFTEPGGGVLRGAQLIYNNPSLQTEVDPLDSIHPTIVTPTFTLADGAGATTVLETKNAADGFGTYTLEFGYSAEYAKKVNQAITDGVFPGKTPLTEAESRGVPNAADANLIENGSVQLFVPGGAVKKTGTDVVYSATITWNLVTAL